MVLGYLVQTYSLQEIYVDQYDLCMEIITSAAFTICSTKHRLKGFAPEKQIGREMILPIKHVVFWKLIRHQNKAQIIYDNFFEI